MKENMYTTNAKNTSVKTIKRTIIINGECYEMNQHTLATSCMICGECVPMSYPKDYPKICDECKKAVMKMRERLIKGKEK